MIELIIGIFIGSISTILLVYVYTLNILSIKKSIKNDIANIWNNSKDWEF